MRQSICRIILGIFFIAVMAAIAAAQNTPSGYQNSQAPRVYQLVVFKLGSAWIKGAPPMMQPGIQEHTAYMSKLIKENILVLGGALFEDAGLFVTNGAVMILAVDTPEGARKILESDPANRSALIQIIEIRPLMIMGASWIPPQIH